MLARVRDAVRANGWAAILPMLAVAGSVALAVSIATRLGLLPLAPTVACPANLQTAIDATPAGGTLALGNCAYTTTVRLSREITVTGGILTAPLASSYVVRVSGADVTIDGLTTSGGFAGIWADPAVRLVVRNARISDASYGGIMVLSGYACTIANNLVSRIGVGQPNGTNAYGIGLTYSYGNSVTTDCTVSGNTVTDVPTWHAFDTHGGQRIAFIGNTARNASRAFFLTDGPSDLTMTGNTLDRGTATFNLVGLTLFNANRVTVTGNKVTGYGASWWLDDEGGSTGIDIQNNTVTP